MTNIITSKMCLTFISLLMFFLEIEIILATYDLIDPTPLCYDKGICEVYGAPGDYEAIHPNSEEKAQMTLINLARMYPDFYINSVYGRKLYGRSGPAWSYDTEGYCGQAASQPYWWLSSFNQASRFAEWDCATCDGSCGHNTCSNPDRCSLFDDDCGFGARCDAIVEDDDIQYGTYCSGEGLCGGNLCFSDGHCSAMFNPNSRIFGVGFEPKTNGIAITYVGYGSDDIETVENLVNYPIPNVCHIDERVKVNYQWVNSQGNHLTFILQWFSDTKELSKAWVIHDGQQLEMGLLTGTSTNGFYQLQHQMPTIACKPYYFIVETTTNEYYRMPENNLYMFGTAWSPWSWWQPGNETVGEVPERCEENHYYSLDTNGVTDWIDNGGPGTGYETPSAGCTGCSEAETLALYWTTLVGTGSDTTLSPTPNTPAPTVTPTTPSPTDRPSDHPTGHPTDRPTYAPTDKPSNIPTNHPTNHPTSVTSAPTPATPSPTDHPTDKPTGEPTNRPTNTPVKHPTNDPTPRPTNHPSDKPTEQPSNRPTNTPSDDPSGVPTPVPSNRPTIEPTNHPSDLPTAPFYSPTVMPVSEPSLLIETNSGGSYRYEIRLVNVPTTETLVEAYLKDDDTNWYAGAIEEVAHNSKYKVVWSSLGANNIDTFPYSVRFVNDLGQEVIVLDIIDRIESGDVFDLETNFGVGTSSPTHKPTNQPTGEPTNRPTGHPTNRPTNEPTTPVVPTASPTTRPTDMPSDKPTGEPSNRPTNDPTLYPTDVTLVPTSPTKAPTKTPVSVSGIKLKKTNGVDKNPMKFSANDVAEGWTIDSDGIEMRGSGDTEWTVCTKTWARWYCSKDETWTLPYDVKISGTDGTNTDSFEEFYVITSLEKGSAFYTTQNLGGGAIIANDNTNAGSNNDIIYIFVGVGIGSLLLIICLVVAISIYRKKQGKKITDSTDTSNTTITTTSRVVNMNNSIGISDIKTNMPHEFTRDGSKITDAMSPENMMATNIVQAKDSDSDSDGNNENDNHMVDDTEAQSLTPNRTKQRNIKLEESITIGFGQMAQQAQGQNKVSSIVFETIIETPTSKKKRTGGISPIITGGAMSPLSKVARRVGGKNTSEDPGTPFTPLVNESDSDSQKETQAVQACKDSDEE